MNLFNRILFKFGYMRIDDDSTEELLYIAKERENKRVTEYYKLELEKLENSLERKRIFDVAEERAVIKQLEKELEEMHFKVENAEKVYYECMRGAKTNLRLSTEIKFQVKRLFENSGEIFQAFQQIEDHAQDHERELAKRDVKFKELLNSK